MLLSKQNRAQMKRNKAIQMVLIIGVLSSLFGCISNRKKAKIEQKLHARIAEFTPMQFDITDIYHDTNEGEMDFSQKAATYTWKEDPEVQFRFRFGYKSGKLTLSEKQFFYWFNRAKKDIDNRRVLEPLINQQFKNVFGANVNNETSIEFNCSNTINDETVHQEIAKAREFAMQAAKTLGKEVDVRIGYTTKTEEELELKYCRPMFEYSVRACGQDGEFLGEIFKNHGGCEVRELEELVQGKLNTTKVEIWGKEAYYRNVKANPLHDNYDHVKVDWFKIIAYKDEQKITGKINIHTREIVWDEEPTK